MHVTGGHNDALFDFYFTAGADELGAGGTSNITAVTDGRIETHLASIGQGKLDLGFRAQGSNDAQFHGVLGGLQTRIGRADQWLSWDAARFPCQKEYPCVHDLNVHDGR